MTHPVDSQIYYTTINQLWKAKESLEEIPVCTPEYEEAKTIRGDIMDLLIRAERIRTEHQSDDQSNFHSDRKVVHYDKGMYFISPDSIKDIRIEMLSIINRIDEIRY